MKIFSKNNFLLILLTILILILSIFLYRNYQFNTEQKNIKITQDRLNKTKYFLDNTSVLAKAFAVYDITARKEIYNKNGDEILPIASLTKIMTVIIVLENHNIDDAIYITDDLFGDHGGSKLEIGEKWKIGDLAKLTLIASSNGGAYALSQNNDYFLAMMNEKAKMIGMQHASFFNPTGIDVDLTKPGALASAKDINTLAIYAYENYGDIFSATTLPEMQVSALSGEVHSVFNTNYVLNKFPNVLLSKTGNTELAGGTLTIIFKNYEGHKIAVTLLGSTIDGRFADMEKIINVLQYTYGATN